MTTNLQGVATRLVTSADPGVVRDLWTRALGHLQSAVCGLHGHDPLLQFDAGRVYLRCSSCGHESPGWKTEARGPRLRYAGDKRRHRLN
jgi:hypothetical protein